ncbi:hypothetical protein [uncultured Thermosynechococcus sp.]|uniref:hypothetical protein n=1 Tax=uncultured Thermosynechococcus sp. TaxID=436945 RepID=UPI00261C39F7|nr:hypothetical protein [uncultured Thermosynechococcus sp.]
MKCLENESFAVKAQKLIHNLRQVMGSSGIVTIPTLKTALGESVPRIIDVSVDYGENLRFN